METVNEIVADSEPIVVDETPPSTFVAADGTRLSYREVGTGTPTLVLCNGLGMDSALWMHVIRYFCKTHRVISWDYRGHGLSERTADLRSYTLETFGNDLRALLDHLQIPTAVLLGHSMGVQVILDFFRAYPDRVLGLIPICGSYRNPLQTLFYTDKLETMLLSAGKLVSSFDGIFGNMWGWLAGTWLVRQLVFALGTNRYLTNPGDMDPYFENLKRVDQKVFFTTALSMAANDALPLLDQITAPTLIIAGENDHFTPLKVSYDMHMIIPNSDLLVLKAGSHCGLLDYPLLINLRIEKFLRDQIVLGPMKA